MDCRLDKIIGIVLVRRLSLQYKNPLEAERVNSWSGDEGG